MAHNLGLDPFPDPVDHFGGPWRPFWILQAVRRCRRWASAPGAARLVFIIIFSIFFPFSGATLSHRRSAWIKKLNLGVDHFPDSVGHFGAPWRLFCQTPVPSPDFIASVFSQLFRHDTAWTSVQIVSRLNNCLHLRQSKHRNGCLNSSVNMWLWDWMNIWSVSFSFLKLIMKPLTTKPSFQTSNLHNQGWVAQY